MYYYDVYIYVIIYHICIIVCIYIWKPSHSQYLAFSHDERINPFPEDPWWMTGAMSGCHWLRFESRLNIWGHWGHWGHDIDVPWMPWSWSQHTTFQLLRPAQLCEPNMQPTKIGTALQASVFCRRWRCVLMRSATDIWWGATVSITWAPNNKYVRLSTTEIILKGCRSCLNTTKRIVKHREFSNLCVGGVCILPQISEILPEKRRMHFYSTTDPCSSTKHTLVMSKISFGPCNLALTMSTLSQVCHWSDFPLIFASNSYRTAGLKRGKGSSYSCECCLLSEETCQKCQRRYVLSSICFSLSSAEAIRSSFILQSTREPYPARHSLLQNRIKINGPMGF